MREFKLTLAMGLALIMSVVFVVPAVAAPNGSTEIAPSGLTAETCNPSGWESVCLSWRLGSDDYTYQEVWFWQTGNTSKFAKGSQLTPHSVSDRPIPIILLNQVRRSIYDNGSDSFTFQVVGVKRRDGNFDYSGFSNEATLVIPRPTIAPADPPESSPGPNVPEPSPTPEAIPTPEPTPTPSPTPQQPEPQIDPTGLSAELCGEAVCLSWIAGTGAFTYQEVRFWKTDDPDNIWYGGGWIVNPKYSQFEYQIANLSHDASDQDAVSYTFQVLGVVRDMGKKVYIGESNTTIQVVPADLMELAFSH